MKTYLLLYNIGFILAEYIILLHLYNKKNNIYICTTIII